MLNFYDQIGKLRTIKSAASEGKVFQAVRKALEPTVVFVLGGPGSGRSTVCQFIEENFGYTFIAVGDLLRAEAAKVSHATSSPRHRHVIATSSLTNPWSWRPKGTERGNKVKRMLANGQLVPTKTVMDLVRTTMVDHVNDKFVIDGFPRSTKQAAAFEDSVAVARFALHLEAPEAVLQSRMRGRPGFKKSYKLYQTQTMGVVDAFAATGRLRSVKASQPMHLLFAELASHFQPKVVFALGPDGSGRAAQCKRLCEQYGYTELSEEELLKCEVMRQVSHATSLPRHATRHSHAEVMRQSKLGVVVNSMIANRQIIPVDLKLQMMRNCMVASGNDKFVVNGFPRALDQSQAWTKAFGAPSVALFFEAKDEVCMVRLAEAGVEHAASEKRVKTFRSQGMPVVNALARSGLLRTVKVAPGMSTEGITAQVNAFLKPQLVTVLPSAIVDANEATVQASVL